MRARNMTIERISAVACVERSRNPREAVLAIARIVDELERHVNNLEKAGGDWGAWDLDVDLTSPVAATRADQPRTNYGALMEATAPTPEAANTEVELDVPTPSLTKLITRARLETQAIRIGDYLNDHSEDWNEAYARGGPVWLYTLNRELVMSLPEDARIAMIQDVEEDNPALAQEMGRDMLKQAGETGPGASAMMITDQL